MIKNIIVSILIMFSFKSFSQSSEFNSEMYVISEGGLNLRKEPGLNSEKIILIGKGSKVVVEQISKPAEVELSNGYRGNWVKVNFEKHQGYVFDAYLSKHMPIDFLGIDKNGCWENDILYDWAIKIGKIDSLEYDSYRNGEGTHRMVIINLKYGYKYIEHYHWEHVENEIQLFGLKPEEIDQFVQSIFRFCKDKSGNLELKEIKKQKYVDISKYEDCCMHNLEIRVIDDKLIIRAQISPGS